MAAVTDTRTSHRGSEMPVALVQDFIRTGLRHDAVADFVAEYVFDALASDGQAPADLGEALRVAFMEIIETSTDEDWRRVGDDLVADTRENLEGPLEPAPETVERSRRARAGARKRRWSYHEDGAQARARRDTAERLIDAHEYLSTQSPGQHFTIIQLASRANLARETLFQQFGRKSGLGWAADARAATRLPALWAELGLTEPGTARAQIKAIAQEYLRLAFSHPGPMRALLCPHELAELLRPKEPRAYRTLQELLDALGRRVAEQDRLLTRAVANATPEGIIDASEVVAALNEAWLSIAARAWQPHGKPTERELFQMIASSTDAVLSDSDPTAA
jgi:AcrR family transcriptional regulator